MSSPLKTTHHVWLEVLYNEVLLAPQTCVRKIFRYVLFQCFRAFEFLGFPLKHLKVFELVERIGVLEIEIMEMRSSTRVMRIKKMGLPMSYPYEADVSQPSLSSLQTG